MNEFIMLTPSKSSPFYQNCNNLKPVRLYEPFKLIKIVMRQTNTFYSPGSSILLLLSQNILHCIADI